MRVKFFSIVICCIIQTSLAFAEQPNDEEVYRQKFIAFMTPRVTEAAFQELIASGIKKNDAEMKIAKWVSGTADCQIAGISRYPPEYKTLAYATVAAGGSIPDATSAMNQRLIIQMGKNEETKQQLTELINDVKEEGSACIDAARLRTGIN